MMTTRILGMLLACLAVGAPAVAEDEATSGWRHTFALYGMGAAIDGSVQIRGIEVPVDLSITELFDNLEMGGMAAYRMENETWSISGDVTYMELGGKASRQAGRLRADLDLDQLTVMGTLGRRLTPKTEVLFSLAYFDLSGDVEARLLNLSRRASAGVDWIDPAVGLQYVTELSDKWRFAARGDVGGFSVGSDVLLHGYLTLQRRHTDRFGWFVGYRLISYDYEEGKGRNYQRYDLTQQGPGAGLMFRF